MKDKPELHFQSRHESGNIYHVLWEVRKIMRKERRITEFNDMRDEVECSRSYEEALEIMGGHVTLIDDDTGTIYNGRP